jgi:C4-dicarboxylate-specific signal transduction histidine kinase
MIVSWKSLRGAQWAVLVGILLSMSFGVVLATLAIVAPDANYYLGLWLYRCLSFIPLSLLVYVAMRFREIIGEVRDNAKKIIQLSDEKKEQAINRQKILQEEVSRQTIELRTSLENLKATQSQLIQSEKMASLGELTAGIAHEIQNPLNFVNNFSDVNRELVDEAKQGIKNGNVADVDAILNDIKQIGEDKSSR